MGMKFGGGRGGGEAPPKGRRPKSDPHAPRRSGRYCVVEALFQLMIYVYILGKRLYVPARQPRRAWFQYASTSHYGDGVCGWGYVGDTSRRGRGREGRAIDANSLPNDVLGLLALAMVMKAYSTL